MQLVQDYRGLLELIATVRNLKSGFETNFFPDEVKHEVWINYEVLRYKWVGSVLLLMKENVGFRNLFYCSPGLEALLPALTLWEEREEKKDTVVDLVGQEKTGLAAKEIFFRASFKDYSSLIRMSRRTPEEFPDVRQNPVVYATLSKVQQVYDLLREYFDPKAEQIPFQEEILQLAKENRVLVYPDGEDIGGFLIFELTKSTLYLRYWFVLPAYRNKGVGSALIQRFFYEGRNTKRQLFWVIRSNENAIKRYRYYGFVEENMLDYVLLKKI